MDRQDKTTVIYTRTATHSVSTDQSLAMQEQACRTYVAAHGWRVGEVFADEGIAGTRRDRPGLSQLLTAVRDHVVERVLIARPDRLSRSHADMKAIVDELEAQVVECVSVEQPMSVDRSATASADVEGWAPQHRRRVALYCRVGNEHQLMDANTTMDNQSR